MMSRTRLTLMGAVAFAALNLSALGQSREPRRMSSTGGQIVERRMPPPRVEGFRVEVLAGGGAREQYPARGRNYVEAIEGEEYSLRLTNPLPVRVAVALSVDGLNTIDARRTTARDASKWVIPPYGSITVNGWQISSTRARRFYFTDERDSYANKLGRPFDTGIITAVFYRERRERVEITPPPRPLESAPRDQSAETKRRTQSEAPSARAQSGVTDGRGALPAQDDEYAATGIGRSLNNDVWRVEMELESSPARELTIRYEFRDALVRLGVLPRTRRTPDHLQQRERARGFEGQAFCPEP